MALKDRLVALKDKWVRIRVGTSPESVRRVKIKEVDEDCVVGVEDIFLVPRKTLQSEEIRTERPKPERANTTTIIPFGSIRHVISWDKDQE